MKSLRNQSGKSANFIISGLGIPVETKKNYPQPCQKIINTINPTKPEKNLNAGDQNLYKVSEITHRPIDTPNKLKLMPNSKSVNHLHIE